MVLANKLLSNVKNVSYCCRRYSQKPVTVKRKAVEKEDVSFIRNIGILAHIDAGKTTTTERMLYFSGTIKSMGEVHHGNTVTDFMDQERERGITITTASVTFPWKNHRINLLDTPGHIDFTMEVEQTLNVLDGAIVVLDGSAGVEAQTLTVWRQANKYNIPRMIYINKLDRADAEFLQSVQSVEQKLDTVPLVTQLPLKTDKSKLIGIIDVVTLQKYLWNDNKENSFIKEDLTAEDGQIWEDTIKARLKLTEDLADLDSHLAEKIITEEKNMESVPILKIRDSLRKVTLEQRGTPILCGSSYKNIGVQQLLDAVIHYLPTPLTNEASKIQEYFGDKLCARAFKVRHDPYKGPITFFRIYSGSLTKGKKIFNMRLEATETCDRLMVAYADDYEEVKEIGCGNIAAVSGLKRTMTGDLITDSHASLAAAKKKLQSKKKDISVDVNNLFTVGAKVPDPVFFCSVEAPSPAYQASLDKALMELEREDPSLKVTLNEETGQTVLAGMGELHLEIIKQRIRREYQVEAETGPLQIAYKELLISPAKDTHVVSHKIGSTRHSVTITMSVFPSDAKGDSLILDRSPDSAENISAIFPKHLLAVKNGIDSALFEGPKLSCPVVNAKVTLHWLEVGKGTSESIIASAANQCVKKLISAGGSRLLEPVMMLEVIAPLDSMDGIVMDLTRRRAEIENVTMRGFEKVLRATVPLAELTGYSTTLRTFTSGKASFTMEFHSFREMTPSEECKAIKSVTGFDPM